MDPLTELGDFYKCIKSDKVYLIPIYNSCVLIDTIMPKKTCPGRGLDDLDDAAFAELAVDEERLHQALEDLAPRTRPGWASIPWPRPHLVAALAWLRYMTSCIHKNWCIREGRDLGSLTSGVFDHDDAYTKVKDITMRPPPSSRSRDWDRESPLITTIRHKSPKKSSPKRTPIPSLKWPLLGALTIDEQSV